MGYPNRGGRSGGGRGFGGGGRSFGGDKNYSRPPMEMHKATCANCGNECEVPFKPTGDRPVYCKDCFAKMGGGRREARPNFERRADKNKDPRESFRPGPPPPPPHDNRQLDEINSKLDKLIALLTPAEPERAPKPAPINEAVEVEEETPKKVIKARKAKVVVPQVESETPEEVPTE